MKDMHSLQCFSSTDSEGSKSFAFHLTFQFQNKIQPFSVESGQEQILEFKSFTTDTRRLRVNIILSILTASLSVFALTVLDHVKGKNCFWRNSETHILLIHLTNNILDSLQVIKERL